jgi:hypothetical protein
MQTFCLVRNTIIAIGWLMTSGHTWFGKHELRQIKNLIVDLGHSHIFTVARDALLRRFQNRTILLYYFVLILK